MNSLGRIAINLERRSINRLPLRDVRTSQYIGQCARQSRARFSNSTSTSPSNSSSSSSSSSPGAGPSRRRALYLFVIPLAFLPFSLFGSSKKPLDPYVYSDHTVGSSARLTPQHALLTVPLSPKDAVSFSTTSGEDGKVVIEHLMVKNPDIQIERPYTPINDVGADGEIKMVIKRVKGGEVGR